MTTNSVRLLDRKQLQVFVWFSIWRGIAAEKYQLTNAMKPPWYSSMFRCFPHRIYLSLESSLSRWKMWSCRLPLPASPAPRISAFTFYFPNLSYFGDLESQKMNYMFFSKSAFNQRAVKSLQWSSHRSRFGTVWNGLEHVPRTRFFVRAVDRFTGRTRPFELKWRWVAAMQAVQEEGRWSGRQIDV